jgi:hypothetical protein
MDIRELLGYLLDTLYAGLTGGSAELPLPQNVILNWVQPGLPFDESAFDFAIAGPFAGPSPLTLPYFQQLVQLLQGGQDGSQPLPRDQAIEQAKLMYQQDLLGSWEQWSRLVDFIPLVNPTRPQTQWTLKPGSGKEQHVGIVYAQAGQTLSDVYGDTLKRSWVANEELTDEQKKLIERAKALLQEEVEVEDFLTGEKKTEIHESRVMTAYKAKRNDYENAVIDYATRLARANNGTAQDLIEWSQSGGIYKRRAAQALSDWVANGYKDDVEKAQATIDHITGGSMVAWIQRLSQDVEMVRDNVQGSFGYPFFPAAILPGGFARSSGWMRLSEHQLHTKHRSSSSSRDWGASGGLNLGLFSIGASGGGSSQDYQSSFQQESFGVDFEYTQVEIVRPWFNPNFFLSRGWKPRDEFIRDHNGQALHSDGKPNPAGVMIGYPTKALFVRNLTISSQSLATFMSMHQDEVHGGGSFGWGPFNLGGHYAQRNKREESNLDIQGATITIRGLQLVGFLSALFPYSANPDPNVKQWI